MTDRPRSVASLLNERRLSTITDFLATEDAGFRRLFILSGIRPIFVEFDQLIQESRSVVEKIAIALAVPINYEGLDQALALAGPYDQEPGAEKDREEAILKITQKFAYEKWRTGLDIRSGNAPSET